jgi:Serine carboxypeptidase S28
LEHRYYGQS